MRLRIINTQKHIFHYWIDPIKPNMEFFTNMKIIAEVGVNHNGSIDAALELVKAAKDAGADIVKFQLFDADQLVQKHTPVAAYQAANDGRHQTQYEMLKALELSYDEHIQIKRYCDEIGIKYLATAFDGRSLQFLADELKQNIFKIASGEITNGPFIEQHVKTGGHIVLSTGMSTIGEIEAALSLISFFLLNPGGTPTGQNVKRAFREIMPLGILAEKVTLLHCSSEYPASLESVHLHSMKTIGNSFGLPYGYSDHTIGLEVSICAAALGASVIEKHFTLDKSANGPDHAASITPTELKELVTAVRNVEIALGSKVKLPSDAELDNSDLARKSIVAAETISKGDIFNKDNLTTRRPGQGISPMRYWDLLGKKASRDYFSGEMLDDFA